jgi:hypothetical protein
MYFTSWGWAGNFGELSFGFQASAARPSDEHEVKNESVILVTKSGTRSGPLF